MQRWTGYPAHRALDALFILDCFLSMFIPIAMNPLIRVSLLGALLFVMSCAGSMDTMIFVNGRIYTQDDRAPVVSAMVVQDGRIVATGSDDSLRASYPDAWSVDLEGRTVLPGLIDAHAHVMGLGVAEMNVRLEGTRSIVEVIERLQSVEVPEGSWLTGRGWDQNDWPTGAFPTRRDLDAAFPSTPVWLRRVDGHAGWANTAALRAAGIDPTDPMADPPGGKIYRFADGAMTGLMIDDAMYMVQAAIPENTGAWLDAALERSLSEAVRHGITSVHDAGADLSVIERFRRFHQQGMLLHRLYVMTDATGDAFEWLCNDGLFDTPDDRLTVRSAKFYMDGALGSRGAAMLAPYADDPGNIGLIRTPPDSLVSYLQRAKACGIQPATHAIGDRGNRIALEAYRMVYGEALTSARTRIEHAQVVAPEDLRRFSEDGIIASVQPTHATSDMYWAEDRVGSVRIQGAYAWQSLAADGGALALGSDYPVEQVSPFLGLYAAVSRQDLAGFPEGGWYQDQALTRAEALYGFTVGAAYAAFQEDRLGRLVPGYWADFIVIDRDFFSVPVREIADIQVLETWVGGERVFVMEEDDLLSTNARYQATTE